MKRYYYILFAIAFSSIFSCEKTGSNVTSDEIVIKLDGVNELDITTKADPVTSIPGTLYWGGTTGGSADGSSGESGKWSTASGTVYSGYIYTGYFQTATPTYYNYYAANASFTAGGDMSVPNNYYDIVAGRTYSSNSTTPSVTLNHIFARTGSLTFNYPSGYSVSSVSWEIVGYSSVNGTAGTFNMRTQSWTSASSTLSSYISLTDSSNYYLIPGSYTVKITFTLTKGEFSKTYTQTGVVTLAANKINNITATTTTNEAAFVTFTTSIATWTSSNGSMNFQG